MAVEPLLTSTLDELRDQHARGVVDFGTILLRPEVVSIDAQRATVVDCQDASKSGTLDAHTGTAKTIGSARTPFTGVLNLGQDGHWRLSAARFLDGSC